MQVAVQQASWDYVLVEIDRIYVAQQELEERKKLRTVRRQQQQVLIAKSAFQQELDQAISPKMQAGLGMEVSVAEKLLPQLHFVVRFEFLGKQWLLTSKRNFFRYQWQLLVENQCVFTDCSTGSLEKHLCYALGKYKNSVSNKVRVLAQPSHSKQLNSTASRPSKRSRLSQQTYFKTGS